MDMPKGTRTGKSSHANGGEIMQKLLTLKEVQERLRLSKPTVRRLINEEPTFRTVKLGKRRLMTEEALREFVLSKEEVLPGVKAN
jgi:excisionase family DNA binding protein